MPLPGAKKEKKGKGAVASFDDDLSRTIVDCEVNTGAWTLMHRCNKAADLLGDVLGVGGKWEHRLSLTPCNIAAL